MPKLSDAKRDQLALYLIRSKNPTFALQKTDMDGYKELLAALDEFNALYNSVQSVHLEHLPLDKENETAEFQRLIFINLFDSAISFNPLRFDLNAAQKIWEAWTKDIHVFARDLYLKQHDIDVKDVNDPWLIAANLWSKEDAWASIGDENHNMHDSRFIAAFLQLLAQKHREAEIKHVELDTTYLYAFISLSDVEVIKQHLTNFPLSIGSFVLKGSIDEQLKIVESLIPHLTNVDLHTVNFTFVLDGNTPADDMAKIRERSVKWPDLLKNCVSNLLFWSTERTKRGIGNGAGNLDLININDSISISRRQAHLIRLKNIAFGDKSTDKKEGKDNTSLLKTKKINLEKLRGKSAIVGLQMHVQMQEQSQQQQQSQQQKQEQQQQAAQEAALGVIGEDNLIDYKKFTSDEYRKNQGCTLPETEAQFAKIWKQAVGTRGFEHNITFLTEAASKELLRSPYEYSGGFKFDNLPKGFFLQKTDKGSLVLDYDPEYVAENKNLSPLTLKKRFKNLLNYDGTPKYYGRKEIKGSLAQFIPGDTRDIEAFIKEIDYFDGSYKSYEEFDNLIKKLLASENLLLSEAIFKKIKELIILEKNEKNKAEVIHNYKDIIKKSFTLFLEAGLEGLDIITDALLTLKKSYPDDAYFKYFYDNYYPEFSSIIKHNHLAVLADLASLSQNEWGWFVYLYASHGSGNPGNILPELLTSFKYFVKEFKVITNHSLPPPPTLTLPYKKLEKINMLTVMDRMLDIVRMAKENRALEVQLQHLANLDYGPEGAYYAMKYAGYRFVTPEMEIGDDLSREKEKDKEEKDFYQTILYNFSGHLSAGKREYEITISNNIMTIAALNYSKNLEVLSAAVVGHFKRSTNRIEYVPHLVTINNECIGNPSHLEIKKPIGISFEGFIHGLKSKKKSLLKIDLLAQQNQGLLKVNLESLINNTEDNRVLFFRFIGQQKISLSYPSYLQLKRIISDEETPKVGAGVYSSDGSIYYEDFSTQIKNKTFDQRKSVKKEIADLIKKHAVDRFNSSLPFSPNLNKEKTDILRTYANDIYAIAAFTTTHLRAADTNLTMAACRLEDTLGKVKDKTQISFLLNLAKSWHAIEPTVTFKEINAIIYWLVNAQPDLREMLNLRLQKHTALGKENFLTALVNLATTVAPVDLDTFLTILEDEISESNSKIPLILSLLNSKEFTQEKGIAFIKFCGKFALEKNDIQHNLLDVLASISIKSSPTIDQLTAIVQSAKSADFNSLCALVKQAIPNCELEFGNRTYNVPMPELFTGEQITQLIEDMNKIGLELDRSQLSGRNQFPYLLTQIENLPLVIKLVVKAAIQPKLNLMIDNIEAEFRHNLLFDLFGEKSADADSLNVQRNHYLYFLETRLKPDFANLQFIDRYNQMMVFYQQAEALTSTLYRFKLQFPKDFPELLALLADPNRSIAGNHTFLTIESMDRLLSICYESTKFSRRLPVTLLEKLLTTPEFKDTSIPTEAKTRVLKAIEQVLTLTHLNTSQREQVFKILFANIKVINPEELIDSLKRFTKIWPHNVTDILNIIDELQTLKIDIKDIVNNLAVIENILKVTDELPKNFVTYFIRQYRNNPNNLYQLTKFILNLGKRDKELSEILTIAAYASSVSLEESKSYVKKLAALDIEDLANLVKLFKLNPVPTFARIVSHLDKGSIKELIKIYPANPFGDRTPETLREQFNTQRVDGVLAGIADLTFEEQPLTAVRKARLHQWFTLVNTLGQDDSHPIYKDENKAYAAKDLSTKQIQSLVKKYHAIVGDNSQSEHAKLTARLSFLALAREMMYRTTGRFANSTQILTIANAMMKGGNVLSELPTGQGKGLTSALLASVLWLEGQTVDVCTANAELASRDLKENSSYYTGLGITHGQKSITRDSKPEDYCIGGINYSGVAELPMYRGKLRIENRFVDPKKVSLVADECDFTILDDTVHYRYAKNLFPVDADGSNSYEWLYTAINEIMKPLLASKQKDTYLEDVRAALLEKANKSQQEQVQSLSDKQLETWMRSSAAAINLRSKENIIFTVQQDVKVEAEEEKPISVARIIINHRPNQDTQWSNGVHQFLHALLEAERKEKPNTNDIPPFVIEPEIAPVVTTSSKNFLDFYRERGVICGMSGTLGSKKELQEQQEKFGVSMFRVPSHQPNIRIDQEAILAENEEEKFKIIGDEVIRNLRQQQRFFWQRDGKPEPLLFQTTNIEKARKLHDYLAKRLEPYKKKYPILTLQLFNGVDTIINGERYVKPDSEHRSEEEVIVESAGLPGYVTISTPMLGRGTNIIPRHIDSTPHKEGLFGIEAAPFSERVRGQFIGRSGRQGQPGRTLAFYSKEELFGQTIKEFQQAEELKSSAERAMRETQSDISNAVFTVFIRLYDSLASDAPELQTNLLRLWKDYLEEIEQDWTRIVEEDLVNEDEVSSETIRVMRCANLYKKSVSDRWNKLLTHFINSNDLEIEQYAEIQLTDKKIQSYLDSLKTAVVTTLPSYAQFSKTSLEPNIDKLYNIYNPVNLLSDKKAADSMLEDSKPKPSLEDTKTSLRKYLNKYKQAYFKARDRDINVENLEKEITAAKSREELFERIMDARKFAMESDRAADKNATFFRRNLTGSRYQLALIKMHNQLISEENADGIAPWMVAYHAMQTALLHRPKYDKPKISNLNGWKDLSKGDKAKLKSMHIKNVMPAVKEKIKESLLDGEAAKWTTPAIVKEDDHFMLQLEVTIIRPDRTSYSLNTKIEIDTALKTMTPNKPTLQEIAAPSIHQRQDSLWKIKKNRKEDQTGPDFKK